MSDDRFSRQRLIEGWNQSSLGETSIAVIGHDLLSELAVWALASLGFGFILWIGRRRARLQSWLLAPHRFDGSRIIHYPFEHIEYKGQLEWALARRTANVMIACGLGERECALVSDLAANRDIRLLSAASGDPVRSMTLAGLLTDAAREMVMPLHGGVFSMGGSTRCAGGKRRIPATLAIVGIGGIGTWAAAIAAMCGFNLFLVDDDVVDATNLNRQALFEDRDAQCRAPKAAAAARELRLLFPGTGIRGQVLRIEKGSWKRLTELRPAAVLSAVDNSRTRLLLQQVSKGRWPLIHGATDVAGADCYVQDPTGATLDAQMNGALGRTAKEERAGAAPRRAGGCGANPSYVVPGLVCGAMMVSRARKIVDGGRGLYPLHWRSQTGITEQRRP